MGLVDGELFPGHCDWAGNMIWRERCLFAPKNPHPRGGERRLKKAAPPGKFPGGPREGWVLSLLTFGAGAGASSAALQGGGHVQGARSTGSSMAKGEGGWWCYFRIRTGLEISRVIVKMRGLKFFVNEGSARMKDDGVPGFQILIRSLTSDGPSKIRA